MRIFSKIFTHAALLLSLCSASTHLGASLLETLEVDGQTIYTTAQTLKSGKTVYFAFEPIYNQDRVDKWGRYLSHSKQIANKLKAWTTDRRAHSNYEQTQAAIDDIIKQQIPTNEALRTTLIENRKTLKSFCLSHNNVWEGVRSGIAGFNNYVDNHVCYVSSKSITGFFPFPDDMPEAITLEKYAAYSLPLIMSVSSFISAEDAYQNRGIFRNPLGFLIDDYPGLGLLAHGVTGLARQQQDPKFRFMFVNPDGNTVMWQILMDNFDHTEAKFPKDALNDQSISEYSKVVGNEIVKVSVNKSDIYKNKFSQSDDTEWKGYLGAQIKVDALVKKFNEYGAKPVIAPKQEMAAPFEEKEEETVLQTTKPKASKKRPLAPEEETKRKRQRLETDATSESAHQEPNAEALESNIVIEDEPSKH